MTTSPAPDHRPAVLLLHGLCANPLELMPLGRVLSQAGYAVEIPALPGYGVSASDGRQLAVPPCEQWLALACSHYDALASRHAQVVVGGLSMGAVLALALARERPAAALLLLSTPLHFDGWNVSPWRRLLPLAYVPPLRGWLRFRERPPYGIKNERLRTWVGQALASQQVSAAGAACLPASALYQASRLIRHVRAHLHQIGSPALVLHASQDDVCGPRSVHELQLGLPRMPELHWFHDSYHMLTLDNERVAVAAAARDFLLRHVPAARPSSLSQGVLHEQHA